MFSEVIFVKDLTKGNISKNLWQLALPALLAGVLSYVLTTIDQVMLGKIVGDVGLAAVGATASFFGILWGIHGALTFAFGARFAYLVGTGDGDAVKRAYKINMLVNAVVGAVITAGAMLLWRPLFHFLNVPADVFEEAKRYYLFFSVSFFFFIISGNLSSALLSCGNSTFPMRVGIIGAVCNVGLNYIMIVPFGMGAMGAAVATMIVSAGSALAYALKLHSELAQMNGKGAHPSLSEYLPILKLLLPTLLQQMVMHIFAFVVQPTVNSLGKTSIAALAVCVSLCDVITIGYKQFSQGVSVFIGQSLGHGQPSLIRRGIRIAVHQILVITLPLILLLMLFPRIAPLVFLADPYGEAAAIVIDYVYCCIPFTLFLAFSNMLHNVFRGVLRPEFNIAGGIALGVMRAALTIPLVPVIGVYGVFIGYSASWTADFLVMLVFYLSKKWKSESYLKAEQAERAACAETDII